MTRTKCLQCLSVLLALLLFSTGAMAQHFTELRGHGQEVNSAVFSPDGARVVTANYDGMEGFNQESDWEDTEQIQTEFEEWDGGFGFFMLRLMFWGTVIGVLVFFERRNEQPFSRVSESSLLAERTKPENAFNQNLIDEERTQKAGELGQAILDSWSDSPDTPGYKTIANRSQAKKTKNGIKEIIALSPTDPDTIRDLNEIIDVYNAQSCRYSVASQGVITLVLIFIIGFSGILYFASGGMIPYFFLAFGADFAAYLVAARAPLYLIQNGVWIASSGVSSALAGAAIAGVGSYEETRYIDRSTGATVRTETDHTPGFMYLIFLFMFAGITVMLLPLLVLINIVRNHIIYT